MDATRVKRYLLLIIGASGVLLGASTRPALAQEWDYRASVYAWLSGLDGTIGVGRVGSNVPVDASFSDLANFLDFAAAGHFEAQNKQLVLIGDVNYVGLGGKRDAEIEGETVSIDMDYNQWILQLGGGYRLTPELDALLVGRYYIQDVGATRTEIGGTAYGSTSHSWADVYVGLRWMKPLGEKWWVSARGDIGMGGSDLALFGNAGAGYRFSDLVSLGLFYQILSLDYETGAGADYYKWDVALDGLGVVLTFDF